MNRNFDGKIVLKEHLNDRLTGEIHQLQELCKREDNTGLKLELEYKLAAAKNSVKGPINRIDEFLYYYGEVLIGYIGINDFGGGSMEVNGMVHPLYRRKGIFRRLFSLVMDEWQKRPSKNMLLLTDKKSEAGRSFIASTGASYDHTEYEMILSDDLFEIANKKTKSLILREALQSDALEIAQQNAIYFNETLTQQKLIDIAEERRRGFHIFMATLNGKVVGKVHLHLANDEGGIFGLGILPEFRAKGLGRELLLCSVDKLMELGSIKIFLQVDAENDTALGLYKSSGFEEIYSMEYYKLKKKGRDV